MSPLLMSVMAGYPTHHEEAQAPLPPAPNGIPPHLLPAGQVCTGCEPEFYRPLA